MAKIAEQSSFSFRAEDLRRVREEGLAAYRELHATFVGAPRWLGMPDPTPAMPLRVLVGLGGSAASGDFTPAMPGGSPPPSGALADWFARREAAFREYFPEALAVRNRPPWSDWAPPPPSRFVGELIDVAGGLVAAGSGLGPVEGRLYALVRDNGEELGSLVDALDGELDRLVRAVFALRFESDVVTESVLLNPAELEAIVERDADVHPAAAILAAVAHEPNALGELLTDHLGRADEIARAARAAAPAGGGLDIAPRSLADTPSAQDLLGFEPLVRGLHALIVDERTVLPLAIGVCAPWGAGKSSAMLQLRALLDADPRWRTVQFDAWKYENSERLWAALAKAIYEQPVAAMPRWQRARFRARLEWRRLGLGRFALRALPALVLAAVAVAVAAVADSLVAAVGGAIAGAGVASVLAHSLGAVADPFKRAIERYANRSTDPAALGFTSDAAADVDCLTDLLTERDSRLAVFVDDLDRCSPAHVVEVVEAVNQIFTSVEGRDCVFVLGMDRDVVAASIEVAYGSTVEHLKDAHPDLARGFGYAFLAKIVQLSVTVPQPREPALQRYLAHITGREPPVDDSVAPPAEVARFRERLAALAPTDPVDVRRGANVIAGRMELSEAERAALREAEREERGRLFSADSEDVAAAEAELLGRLARNPREVKRFDNALRLQLHVANGTPGSRLAFDRDDLVALGKWVVLRLRWPRLARALDRDPALLAALEAHVNGGEPIPPNDPRRPWLDDRALADLLREDDDRRRIARLPFDSFLHVA